MIWAARLARGPRRRLLARARSGRPTLAPPRLSSAEDHPPLLQDLPHQPHQETRRKQGTSGADAQKIPPPGRPAQVCLLAALPAQGGPGLFRAPVRPTTRREWERWLWIGDACVAALSGSGLSCLHAPCVSSGRPASFHTARCQGRNTPSTYTASQLKYASPSSTRQVSVPSPPYTLSRPSPSSGSAT